jgi:rhodanese-related sulfurtransferase
VCRNDPFLGAVEPNATAASAPSANDPYRIESLAVPGTSQIDKKADERREASMTLTLVAIGIAMAGVMVLLSVKRGRNRSELERHSLSAEQLESLMASGEKVYLFDVRQPLDLLAYPELIPGAQRIPPEEVLKTPSLLPRDEDIVVYCTCPGDKTSLSVLHRALALGFTRIKFLTGGLAAWKGKGYPVEPYRESFRLSIPTVAPPAQ